MLSPRNKGAKKRFREPFGKAGLTVAILALVFAMVGGAWAAAGLNSKQKKEVKSIAKSFQGTGPAGAAGPAGAKGDNGANGSSGAKGDKGDTGDTGKQGIQGKEGSPWTAGGTLPSKATETGTFVISEGGGEAAAEISFPIPLASSLGASKVHVITADGSKEVLLNESSLANEEVAPTGCGSALSPAGTVENPKAAAGNLCVYLGGGINLATSVSTGSNLIMLPSVTCSSLGCLPELGGPANGNGAAVSGARVELSGALHASGTYAVTAP